MNNKKLSRFEDEKEKVEYINDDSGYELDDSGIIPKLEELKASTNVKDNNEKISLSEYDIPDEVDEFDKGDIDVFMDDDIRDFEHIDDFDEIEDDLSNLKVNFYDEYDEKSEIAKQLSRIADALEIIAKKL